MDFVKDPKSDCDQKHQNKKRINFSKKKKTLIMLYEPLYSLFFAIANARTLKQKQNFFASQPKKKKKKNSKIEI